MLSVKQGEIWYADLNPIKGSEQAGMRPVVVVSGNMLNSLISTVIAFPLTTKIKNYKGNLVLSPTVKNGLEQTSEVLIFHIRSLSKERLTKKLGSVTMDEIKQLKQGLDDILRY
jgi:mRNA interferase MazF